MQHKCTQNPDKQRKPTGFGTKSPDQWIIDAAKNQQIEQLPTIRRLIEPSSLNVPRSNAHILLALAALEQNLEVSD